MLVRGFISNKLFADVLEVLATFEFVLLRWNVPNKGRLQPLSRPSEFIPFRFHIGSALLERHRPSLSRQIDQESNI